MRSDYLIKFNRLNNILFELFTASTSFHSSSMCVRKKLWFDALTYGLSVRVGGGGKQDGDNLSSKSNTKTQKI